MSLKWQTTWQSSVLIQGLILPNIYTATVTFDFNTSEKEKQIVSFDRMQFLFNGILANNMLANVENPLVTDLYNLTDTVINTLPSEPYDEILAAIIMSKIIAITENNILVDQVDVSSSLGNDISNTVTIEDLAEIDYFGGNAITAADPNTLPWWNRSGVDMTDIILFDKDSPIKIIHDSASWEDYELGWIAEKEEIVTTAEPAKVIMMNRWKPKVIKGGKDDGSRPMGPTDTN